MTPLIDSLYTTRRSVAKSGEAVSIDSHIPREEGLLLHQLIADDPSIKRTLEVGCANGLSSLHICEALRGRAGAQHTIVDPFQNSNWKGMGILHLEKAGIDFFDLVEEGSELVLPRFLQRGEGVFDFIFIDGFHTFDHTLLDAFYAVRLLRVGGILVIDDGEMDAIAKVIGYLENYPCLKTVRTVDRVRPRSQGRKIKDSLAGFLPAGLKEKKRHHAVAFKKVSEDERPWNWYAPF